MLNVPVIYAMQPLYGLGSFNQHAFNQALAVVLKNEGGYVFDPDDRGGETYMGIARKIHPTWPGWPIIDRFHADSGIRLNRGAFLPTVTGHQQRVLPLVIQFYQQLFTASRASEIRDQRVINIYFDFYIHSRKAVEKVQETLVRLGHGISIDNRIGSQTLNAINNTDPALLHDAIKKSRLQYLGQLVNAGIVHQKFFPGFKKRLAGFPDLLPLTSSKATNKMLLVTALTVGAIGFWMASEHITQKLNNKDYD